MANSKRGLLWHGMFLFLLGLLTGLSSRSSLTPAWGSPHISKA
jgi:hypothetical protein